MKRHLTRHGTNPQGGALDDFDLEREVLGSLFASLESTLPSQAGQTTVAGAEWNNGPIAKLDRY